MTFPTMGDLTGERKSKRKAKSKKVAGVVVARKRKDEEEEEEEPKQKVAKPKNVKPFKAKGFPRITPKTPRLR